jgi:colanic acid biosynthesis glycosyl transferase WcaI
VLSYLSAGRPIVALVPDGNPSAADVRAAGGYVADPTPAGASEAACWLAATAEIPAGLVTIGTQARNLATDRFNIDRIGSEFELVLTEAASQNPDRGRAPLIAVAQGGRGGMCA